MVLIGSYAAETLAFSILLWNINVILSNQVMSCSVTGLVYNLT